MLVLTNSQSCTLECDNFLCRRLRGNKENRLQSACRLRKIIAESVQKEHCHSWSSNSCLIMRDNLTESRAASSSRREIVIRPEPLLCDFAIIRVHLDDESGKIIRK